MPPHRQGNLADRRSAASSAATDLPYWLRPVFMVTFVIGLGVFLFDLVSDDSFLFELRVQRMDPTFTTAVYVGILLCILLGMAVAHRVVPKQTIAQSVAARNRMAIDGEATFRGLGYSALVLALFSYALYFGMSGFSIAAFQASLSGEIGANYALRGSFEKIPGVTSFMSVAPWWFAYVAYSWLVLNRPLNIVTILLSGILFLAVALRAVVDFERRAIIDIFVPAVVVVLFCRTRYSRTLSLLIRLAPAFGIVFLVGLFMATEYVRTWIVYYANISSLTYGEWALLRLGGYYTTSINNGIAALTYEYTSNGYYTLHGIYRFPILADLVGLGDIRNDAVYRFTDMLEAYLNPEFNNQGGAIVPIIDFGYFVGGVILFVYGFLGAYTYLTARAGSIAGLFYYTFFYFSFLEITRIWYIMGSTTVMNMLFLTAFLILYKPPGRRAVASSPADRPRLGASAFGNGIRDSRT